MKLSKIYNEESDEGYFLKGDIQYPEHSHERHNDLPLLPERMKIENVEKLLPNLHVKSEYIIHIRSLNHGLILKKVHSVIKFNQKAWLKPHLYINTKLRQKAKNKFEKDFFKLINNAVCGKKIYRKCEEILKY